MVGSLASSSIISPQRLLGGYFNAKYKHLSTALDPNPYCIISFSEKVLFLFLVFSNGSNQVSYGFLSYLVARRIADTLRRPFVVVARFRQFPRSESQRS